MDARTQGRFVGTLVVFGLVTAACAGLAAAADDVLAQGNLPGTYGVRFGPNGNLYVCALAAGIAVIDLTQGQMVDLIGPERGVFGPEDVNFGPDGSMYWAQMFTGEVGRMAPDGTVTTQMIGPGVNSIVFSADGRMFVTEPWYTDTLYEVDPALVDPPELLAQGIGGLKNPEFGPDGLMYGALSKQGRVVKIDVDVVPPTFETIADDILGPFNVKFGPDGMLYVLERTGFTIQRMDPATGSHSTYAELQFGPDSMAFAPTGALFVTSYSDGVVAVVLPGGAVQPVMPGGLTIPSGIAVKNRGDGESVFVGSLFSLREYDGATGAELSVDRMAMPAAGFAGAISVSDAGENLVLTNFFPVGRVQVWNPDSDEVITDIHDFPVAANAIAFGDDLIIVDLGMGQGEARVVRVGDGGTSVLADVTDQIVFPLGLVASDGDLWVGDWATGMVWQLIADGVELAQAVPVAVGLSGPEGLALDLDGSLLVVEGTAGRVSRIRLESGVVTPVVSGLELSSVGTGMLPPSGTINGIAVGSSGAIYVSGDLGVKVYRLVPRTIYLPGAANVAGANGSHWTTDLELMNRGATSASYSVELLVRGQANPVPEAVSFDLASGRAVRYANVLDSLFEAEGAGTLRITTVRGDLMASARTASRDGDGFFGQYIEGMNGLTAAGSEQRRHLIQLQNDAAARTNIGVVNACALAIQVDVEFYAADGSSLGTEQLDLDPFGSSQINNVFSTKTLVGVNDAYAIVTSIGEGAAFFAYASVVDNGTNDPIFVPGR
jgi:sugar lactone lactonase YvrE